MYSTRQDLSNAFQTAAMAFSTRQARSDPLAPTDALKMPSIITPVHVQGVIGSVDVVAVMDKKSPDLNIQAC